MCQSNSCIQQTKEPFSINPWLMTAYWPHTCTLATRVAGPSRLANRLWSFSYERWLASTCNSGWPRSFPAWSVNIRYFAATCGVRLSWGVRFPVLHRRCWDRLFSTGASYTWQYGHESRERETSVDRVGEDQQRFTIHVDRQTES
jgi:hypothetical protein